MIESFTASENKLRHLEDISNDIINELEPLSFGGDIYLLEADDPDIDKHIEEIKLAEKIGFDTESRPAFIKGQTFPIALVQIATIDTVYLFRIKKSKINSGLIEILNSNSILKIGLGLTTDIKKLKELSRKIEPKNFADLSVMAKSKGFKKSNARSLVARYLNKKLLKSSQITNWAKKTLTDKQIQYAAVDAWSMIPLYSELLNDDTNYLKI